MHNDYPPTKIPPWKHQIETWHLAKNQLYFYIPHDMGAGKSKTAIDICNGVNAESILIVCPKKVVPHWPKQFKQNSHKNYKILPLIKGTVAQKTKQVRKFISDCKRTNTPHAIVTNVDAFWRPPMGPVYNKRNRIIDPGELMHYDWDTFILDEAHRIKSPSGEASWGAKRVAQKAKRRLFLSGTPFPHSPADIYAQFRALDPSVFGTSFARFKNEYCVMGGYEGRQIVRFKNLDDLHLRFFSHAAPYIKIDDVLDMPPTMDVTLNCQLNPSTMRLYNELNHEFIAEYGNGEITVKNALDKLLRLAQITAGILVLDDGGKEYIDDSKIDTVIDKIEDIPKEEPVVIFYRFKPEVARIKPKLKKTGRVPCEISGSRDEQDLFESGKADTAVVQIRAGGEGIDILKRAHYCFYLSMTYSLGEYRQSRARIWRPGQKEKCFFYHVIAEHTTDVKIMKAIAKKKEIVDFVLEDLRDILKLQLKTGTNN